MGLFSWLFGEKEDKPPEPLVLGARLHCVYGSQTCFLFEDADSISINNLPKACVEDCLVPKNIQNFGKCYAGDRCEFLISLEDKWTNVEPQSAKVNGKEIITTKSTIICNATGMLIEVLTSGQDGVFANQLLLIKEMDEKYPGLRELLESPFGSLYLTEVFITKC